MATDMAMDSQHKALYLNEERSFGCASGGTANGKVLIAPYTPGNALSKPTRSGSYVTELDAGVCGVPRVGLYGCRFDVDETPTQSGAAAFAEVSDDIVSMRVPAGAGPGTASPK